MIITLDLGTTSNRCLAVTKTGQVNHIQQQEFKQFFPKPGWVEHDAQDIASSTLDVLNSVLEKLDATPSVLGITNQRETVVAWQRSTGLPLYNAIVWQCRRTAQRINSLSTEQKKYIKTTTGLIADAYFSASKIEWLVTHCPAVQQAIAANDICFGTIDSWILFKLTAGQSFATDTSNVARTMLVNIHTQQYDPKLLKLFNIEQHWLPTIKSSDAYFGDTDKQITKKSIPIHAILGDQQAALFAQCGEDTSKVKNTYGTGLFVCAATGTKPAQCPSLLTTIAWTRNNTTHYALEGSIFVGGSAIQWCRDQLGLIKHARDSEVLAQSITDNANVYFVPALTGLGAPHWDSAARGLLIGLTRGTSKAHIMRAVLESLAYQTKDVYDILKQFLPNLQGLYVDGGAAENNFLMQFQSDILEVPVYKLSTTQSTAIGVAGLAGIATNQFSESNFRSFLKVKKQYIPTLTQADINALYLPWKNAVTKALGWT